MPHSLPWCILRDQHSLHNELKFLKVTFRENSHSDWQNHRALNFYVKVVLTHDGPDPVIFLTYVVLSQHNFKSAGLPAEENLQLHTACQGQQD
jgi:hypothetical protein